VRLDAGGLRRSAGCSACLYFWGWVGRSRGARTACDAVGIGRARGVLGVFGAVVSTLVLCGCQSTQERSAELRQQAKRDVLASQGVSVRKQNPSVKVLQSAVIRWHEGVAVVVALRNTGTHVLENAPIEITVRDAHGSVVFQNNAPGEEPSLTTVSLLEPGQEAVWVNDQVQATGAPTSVSAVVGEAKQASGNMPQLSVAGTHLSAEATAEATLSGTVSNRSQTTQQNLVVYAVARRSSKIVAAGRAVLPEVSTGTKVPFQIYFVGSPAHAQISTSAPATTF
jgi:hypothetical protein